MAAFTDYVNFVTTPVPFPIDTIFNLHFENGAHLIVFFVQPFDFEFFCNWELNKLYWTNQYLNAGAIYEGPHWGWFELITLSFDGSTSEPLVVFVPFEIGRIVGPLNFNHYSLSLHFDAHSSSYIVM